MDKYEYQVRADQIKSLIAEQKYAEAMDIADTIDWRKVRSVSMLCTVSEIYKINKHYEESRDILLLAYERYPKGRMIVYALCELAIKMRDVYGAIEYYKEFMKIAPGDAGSYILLYKIYDATEVSLEEKIQVLEEYKRQEYKEKWAYELAYLYHKAGEETKCIETCDELILWFGEGKYVKKAMELKMQHARLTRDQQMKYEGREERLNTAPMPIYQQSNISDIPLENAPEDNNQTYGQMYGQTPEDQIPEPPKMKSSPVGNNLYNTQNLQAELAENMQAFLGDNSGETDSVTNVTYSGDPESYSQLYRHDTMDIPSPDLSVEVKPVESPIQTPVEPTYTPESQDYTLVQPSSYVPDEQELIKPEHEHPTLDIPVQISMFQDPAMEEEPVYKMYDGLIGQSSDGQMHLELPDQEMVEKQITGQIELEDILKSWDYQQRESDYQRIEEAKKKSLQQTNDIMAQLKGVIPEIAEPEVDYSASSSVKSVRESRPIITEVNAGAWADSVGNLAGSSIPETPAAPITPVVPDPEEETLRSIEKEFGITGLTDSNEEDTVQEEIKLIDDDVSEVIPDTLSEETTEETAEEISYAEADEASEESSEEIYTESESKEDDDIDSDATIGEDEAAYETESNEEDSETESESTVPEVESDYEAEEEPDAEEISEDVSDEEEPVEEIKEVKETVSDFDSDLFEYSSNIEIPVYDEAAIVITDESVDEEKETLEEASEDVTGEESEEEISEDVAKEEPVDEISEEKIVAGTENAYPYELDDYGEIEEDIVTIDQPEDVDEMLKTRPLPIDAIQQAQYEAGMEISETEVSDPDYMLPAGYNQLLMQQEQQERRVPSYITREAKKSRRDFDEEEIKIFGRYDGIEDLKAQIVDVMDDMNMEASHGNVVIMGKEPVGRKALAIEVVKAIQIMDSTFSGKVAKISGDALNKKNIPMTLRKLQNGALIIENAEGLTANSIMIINDALTSEADPILVVLEGEKKTLEPLLNMAGGLSDQVFNARIDIQDFTKDDFVSYGKKYALEQKYVIDEMGILEFYTRIEELQVADHMVSIDEVKSIIDAAIENANKVSVSRLIGVLTGKVYDDDDNTVLMEKDFQI